MRAPALVLALVLALSWASTAVAEPRAVAPGAAQDRDKLAARYRGARLQRDLGWGLAGLGMALGGTGALTTVYGAYMDGYDVAGLVAGVAITAVGAALAIPGIVLALRGQDGMTDVRWRMKAFGVAVAPLQGGAIAALRFVF
ncbi:MAG: hypothetical protein EXR72_25470 [Myxococcales bacterium]|nr:hypothetical protein [Myxococcales bacterium]